MGDDDWTMWHRWGGFLHGDEAYPRVTIDALVVSGPELRARWSPDDGMMEVMVRWIPQSCDIGQVEVWLRAGDHRLVGGRRGSFFNPSLAPPELLAEARRMVTALMRSHGGFTVRDSDLADMLAARASDRLAVWPQRTPLTRTWGWTGTGAGGAVPRPIVAVSCAGPAGGPASGR